MTNNSVSDAYTIGLNSATPPSFIIAKEDQLNNPPFSLNHQGVRTLPYQPFFNAYLSETLANQTGAGYRANLIANSIISNIGGHYNATSGEFTAPVSGVYHFDCHFIIDGITQAMTYADIVLEIGDYKYKRQFVDLMHINQATVETSQTAYMNRGEKASVSFVVYGGLLNSVSFYGYVPQGLPNQIYSDFSGYLLG